MTKPDPTQTRLARIRARYAALPDYMRQSTRPMTADPAERDEWWGDYSRIPGGLVCAENEGKTPPLAKFYAAAPADMAFLLALIVQMEKTP
jgi:hypothetical protein